jgi:murein DD-endopeptidase MepM/ murein hydrolase activator NlpD
MSFPAGSFAGIGGVNDTMISRPTHHLGLAIAACAAALSLFAGADVAAAPGPDSDANPMWRVGDGVVIAQRRGSGGGPQRGGAEGRASDESSPSAPTHPGAPRDVQERAGVIPTGLKPVYPKEAECLEVASPFAARTRYDGSGRPSDAFGGYHSGIDISTPMRAPLVAVAAGEIVLKYEGGRMVGNRIILRHTPEDTGLNVWVYSSYQHFDSMPELNIGDRVKAGQYLGPAGNTGTTGGHYGVVGYPHLHMTVYVSDHPDYGKSPRSVQPKDVRFLDPVALYLKKEPPLTDNHKIAALPEAEKQVAIAYVTTDGKAVPEGARVVWPIPCKQKP